MENYRKSLALGAFGFLTACSSSYKEQFDCEPGQGVGCKSISQVNELVNTQEGLALSSSAGELSIPVKAETSLHLGEKGEIVRIPEQTMHVLIVGYKDKEGYFHENSHVHMVTKEATWGHVE